MKERKVLRQGGVGGGLCGHPGVLRRLANGKCQQVKPGFVKSLKCHGFEEPPRPANTIPQVSTTERGATRLLRRGLCLKDQQEFS